MRPSHSFLRHAIGPGRSDDPENFQRAWNQPAPTDLRIAHSWYWRSAHSHVRKPTTSSSPDTFNSCVALSPKMRFSRLPMRAPSRSQTIRVSHARYGSRQDRWPVQPVDNAAERRTRPDSRGSGDRRLLHQRLRAVIRFHCQIRRRAKRSNGRERTGSVWPRTGSTCCANIRPGSTDTCSADLGRRRIHA